MIFNKRKNKNLDCFANARNDFSCATPIQESIKSVPMSTGRATCVAPLSRICKFAFRSLTNSTLSQRERVCAFTLAEVLITLGIIGVVAALTLPSLIQNYQKQALATQTKKFYSMMSQAVKQYMADEGVDDLRNTPLARDNYEDETSPEAFESIRNFVTKYLKVVEECGKKENSCFASKYKTRDGENSGFSPGYNVYYRDYVLSDGAIISIGYNYQPLSLYVDVNGKKGPNRVGYDLWDMSIFYDGSIDESGATPECKQGKPTEWEVICGGNGSTPQEVREYRFTNCKAGAGYNSYGGCFGHFLENNFTFDY